MKKNLLVIVTLVGSILVMTACGGKKEEAPAPTPESVQEEVKEVITETESARLRRNMPNQNQRLTLL